MKCMNELKENTPFELMLRIVRHDIKETKKKQLQNEPFFLNWICQDKREKNRCSKQLFDRVL